ncbi:hypothetical protein DFR58_105156 [Anaerobacterium chartisolvens]|uniref:Uncharacterized protein n=1 Tax=Anaerobacterium chartisolvens TaxID=1297424 RepID=A0A369BA46_9FIRM|nr:hypothetical protein [Anaerobacterium chartisolvens]RCX18392.1 hypothetical protein DFR58_105156 [Anaerobacterium chartisolvens]
MSISGIARGLFKTIRGVAEGDGELIAQGAIKTVKSTVTTIVSAVAADIAEVIHKPEDHEDD